MTKLKITVTKEILAKSMKCGGDMGNCAVSQAVRDIFPNAATGFFDIYPFAFPLVNGWLNKRIRISLPDNAQGFIKQFDSTHEKNRPNLPEISFEIEIPEEIINRINIDELLPLLTNHPTLELIKGGGK